MNRPIFVLLLSIGLCAVASPQEDGLQHVQPGGMQPAGRVEAAKHQLQLGRALARRSRYDLIALDEVACAPRSTDIPQGEYSSRDRCSGREKLKAG